MSKKKIKSKNLLDKYNEKQTKGNIENTLLKGAVDTTAGSVIGTGLGALSGDKAVFTGIALILAGHYFDDESGLLRLTGASTMAYGIGKANEYKNNSDLSTPTKRISQLKDDWLTAFHLKWKKETISESQKENESKTLVNDRTKEELSPEKSDLGNTASNSPESFPKKQPNTSGLDDLQSDEDFDVDLTLI